MRHPTRYILNCSSGGFGSEIYFPKKGAYQGAIFTSLKDGFFEQRVIDYLAAHAASLLEELRNWREILDPLKYDANHVPAECVTEQDALRRIAMYKSVFKGYSMYTVDGVFFSDKTQTVYEEATQVIRLMFRFESQLEAQARSVQCTDLLCALAYWLIDYAARLDHHVSWAPSEKARFLTEHSHWPKELLEFASLHFETVAKEVEKWLDDCGLFIFGFLVRQFSENVLRRNMSEEEIWVVSDFEPCINVVRRRLGDDAAC